MPGVRRRLRFHPGSGALGRASGGRAIAMLMILSLGLLAYGSSAETAAATPGGLRADAPSSSVVDLTANIAGPANAVAGSAFTYTVKIANNSWNDADGAPFTVTLPSGASGVATLCEESNGAVCGTITTTDTQVKGSAVKLPHLGLLTVTITGTFPLPSPTSETATVHVDPPDGMTDSDPTSNDGSVSTGMDSGANLSVTKKQSSATTSAKSPVTFTLDIANAGPMAADGASLSDLVLWSSPNMTQVVMSDVTCTTTGGAVCPTLSGGSFDPYSKLIDAKLPKLPASSTVTVTYKITPKMTCGPTVSMTNNVNVLTPTGVTDLKQGDNYASLGTEVTAEACPAVDLNVAKTQSSATLKDAIANTYTVRYTNDGSHDAAKVAITDTMYWSGAGLSSFAVHFVSCTATGGATCPALTDHTVTAYGNVWNATIDLPVASSILITYTATPTVACGPPIDVRNAATLKPPPDVADIGDLDNASSVTASTASSACPEADIEVAGTQKAEQFLGTSPQEYSFTWTNKGPSAASGEAIRNMLSWNTGSFSQVDIRFLSCTATGGANCPILTDKRQGNYSDVISTTLPSFPAGASLTIKYSVTPVSVACGANGSVYSSALSTIPVGTTDPVESNNGAKETSEANCADISVNKSVERSAVQAGEPVNYMIKVTNASPERARTVEFADSLPAQVEFVSASCEANSSASACGSVEFDAKAHKVSSTITQIGGAQDFVTITINGIAGPVPSTYPNTATAVPSTGSDAFFDPILASNSSTVNVQVFNTASTIAIHKKLSGMPAEVPDRPYTFTGTVTCASQPVQSWSVTIPAGATEATSTPLSFFDGVRCEITEDAPPELPAGVSVTGPPAITPDAISKLGTTQARVVDSVTTVQAPSTLSLTVTPDVTNATAGDRVTYGIEVTNTGPREVADISVSPTSFSGSGTAPHVDCPSGVVAPGEAITCTAVYTVTADDVRAGTITLTATATGTPSGGPKPISGPDTAVVTTARPGAASLAITIEPQVTDADQSGDNTAGDLLVWVYTVTNNGTQPVHDLSVPDTGFGEVTCDETTLVVGASTTCRTALYTITASDVRAGVVRDTVSATALDTMGEAVVSAPAADSIDVVDHPAVVVDGGGTTTGDDGGAGGDPKGPKGDPVTPGSPSHQPSGSTKRGDGSAAHDPGFLAFTGFDVLLASGAALMLVAGGVVLIVLRRRRSMR